MSVKSDVLERPCVLAPTVASTAGLAMQPGSWFTSHRALIRKPSAMAPHMTATAFGDSSGLRVESSCRFSSRIVLNPELATNEASRCLHSRSTLGTLFDLSSSSTYSTYPRKPSTKCRKEIRPIRRCRSPSKTKFSMKLLGTL